MPERKDAAKGFTASVSDEHVRREKARARELRGTGWWKQNLAHGVCYYCCGRFTKDALTMDHVVPLARGGVSTKANCVVACKECNNKKRYLLPMEWEEYLARHRVDAEK
jgi:5-methylcytosine-specific restriction endonuclease McrA